MASTIKGHLTRILPNSSGNGPHRLSLFRVSNVVFMAGIMLVPAPPVAGGQDFAASSFVMRNYSPLSALIGIPGRWPDGTEDTAELSWNISNHSLLESDGTEGLLFDGETHTLTARLQHRFSRRIQAGIEIPWISHSGGFLDGGIDAWHRLLGLSEGIRPLTENNSLIYLFEVNGVEQLRFEDASSGFGDIRLSAALDLRESDKPADAPYLSRIPLKLTLSVKAPTGDIEKLTGSGNADLAAGLGVRSPVAAGSRYNWWIDAGLVWPGDVDITGLETSAQVVYYDVAFAWRIHRSFDALLQFAGNSPLYRAGIKNIGRPVAQLGFGGLWHISEKYGLRFGLFEDIRSDSAPDFGVELTLIVKAF